jgi:alpha-methylacyl-CoA racemase
VTNVRPGPSEEPDEVPSPPSGPLSGLRVIELAAIGPSPFCGMVLSDMGADVVRVDRVESRERSDDAPPALWDRGRRSVALDLKDPDGVETLLRLVDQADALIEGYRPGVAERLGVGPETCLDRNRRLVYGRVTGWGSEGPLAQAAGHDLNFIALSGVLNAIGHSEGRPVPPLNLVGDFGGGGMLLAIGVCAALVHAARSGIGQVVDAAMIDGSAQLMTSIFGMHAQGRWNEERGSNLIDSGAPFYDVYETSDGEYVSIAALERRFFADLVTRLGLADDPAMGNRMERSSWPAMRERFVDTFKSKTQAAWCALLEGTDCCFAPVLSIHSAPGHPHNALRGTFVYHDGATQPAPAPRFSETPGGIQRPAPRRGEHTEEVLAEWGVAGQVQHRG